MSPSFQPRKPDKPSGPSARPPHADPGQFAVDYPALAWYLCASSWPDDSVKGPGRIELSIFKEALQATFRVVGVDLMVRVEIPSPESLYPALDAVLRLDPVPWQATPWTTDDRGGKGQKKKT